MGRVLTDRLWRARNWEERADADTDPGRLGSGGENGLSVRRCSLLYWRRPGEAYQQREREHLPFPIRFVHRFLLDRAIIRFSGPPVTTADRDALCKPIGQIAGCPEGVNRASSRLGTPHPEPPQPRKPPSEPAQSGSGPAADKGRVALGSDKIESSIGAVD